MQVTVECQECGRMISQSQLGNHMRSMHRAVGANLAPPPGPDDDGLRFEDPPITGRGLQGQLDPLVVKLRRHPGRWARLRDYAGPTSASTQVKKARELWPDCEWKAAKVDDGSALWARYEADPRA